MSTRATIRFATREDGVSFSEHPEKINAQFYVHSDGYPKGLGLDIAVSIDNLHGICGKINNWEIESLTAKHGDLEYIYYVWQKPQDTTWISIFEVEYGGVCDTCGREWEEEKEVCYDGRRAYKCIFVGEPHKLIEKYKLNTNDDR